MNRDVFISIVCNILMFVNISCIPSKEVEILIDQIVIDLNSLVKQPIDSLVADFKFTPLETNDSVVIQDIRKLLIENEYLYILERHSQEILVSSVTSGKLISKVSKSGFGPGEYGRIGDFQVGEGGTVEILDDMHNKLLKYSGQGDFLSERKVPFMATSFCYLGSDILFSRPIVPAEKEWMYQLIRTSQELNVVGKYLEIGKSSDLVFSPKIPLQNNNSNVNFMPVYDSHIYEVSQTGIRKKYFLNFDDKWPEEKILYAKYAQPFDLISALQKSGDVYFLNYLEGEIHLALFYEQEGEARLIIYNKESKKSTLIKDFESTICFSEEYLDYHDGYFVSVKQPYAIYDLYDQGKIHKNAEVSKLMNSINKLDNPVIMFTKFKN